MKSFNLNSSNTFCISLISHNERVEKMEKRLKEINMDVTIWPACSKHDDFIDPCIHYLNDGARGCAQSHFNIWKHIIQNNIEHALILEDDACFDKQFFEKLECFWTDVNDTEWDAIFLNASESMETLNKWLPVTEQYLTGGYIISKKGAETLINMFSSLLYASDWMTSRLQYCNHSYCYFPWLIIQEGKETTIGSSVDEDHKKVVRLLNDINYSLDNYII
jgi:glycosyl transferase family 25